MKASGKLLYGVQVGDAIHYDYTVTLPVIRHTVNALAATGEAFEDPDSAAARMYYRVAVIAEVFESLGTLAKGEITPEILLDGLTDDDMDIIDAELAGLKKADAAIGRLEGLRRATLILGRFGISPDRIEGMTVAGLTAWLDTLTGCTAKSRQPANPASNPAAVKTERETVNARP
jgi:hypothetical protein